MNVYLYMYLYVFVYVCMCVLVCTFGCVLFASRACFNLRLCVYLLWKSVCSSSRLHQRLSFNMMHDMTHSH